MRKVFGERYRHPANDRLEKSLIEDLPYCDFEETLLWYKQIAVPLCGISPKLAAASRAGSKEAMLDIKRRWSGLAFIGCNDRFFMLTKLCGRVDAIHPWLFERCREVEAETDGYIDLWSRFHYKAVDMRTMVPTPQGWKRHGSLKPGDEVFGPDGKPTKVIARTPAFTDADCWLVRFDKGFEVVVSGDHLWTVEVSSKRRTGVGNSREGRRTETINTRDLAAEVARCRQIDGRVLPSGPVTAPLEYPKAVLPIHPYVLGAWLGDGSSGGTRLTAGINDADEIEGRLKAAGVVVNRCVHSNSVSLRIGSGRRGDRSSSDFTTALRELGVYRHKHIPALYLCASVEQRTALLQGLMDTDGHCDTRGTATFVNKSEVLASNLFELAASLGLKPSFRRVAGTFNGAPYPYFHVSFQARADGIQVFQLERKRVRATSGRATRSSRHAVVSVERAPTIPVSCIQVDRPDGLYLIGEQCIPTHNSTIITFAGGIQEVLRDPEIKIAIFSVVKPIAAAFLSQIKEEFENNELLKQVYGDVLYQNPRTLGADGRPAKWGQARGITVKRKTNPKEATIEAHGLIDGQPTSRHFDLHIYDDMVTQDHLSEEAIRKTTERWELADNLGSHLGVRKWMPGTRYHFADTYSVVMERGSMKPRVYPATDDGKLEGKPVFLSQERWDQIKRDQRSTVSAQCLLNPIAGNEATFTVSMLRPYDVFPAVMNVYILVDPSKGKTQRSDRTAIAVIGVDPGGNKYLLDGFRHRMKLSERWEKVSMLRDKWYRHPGVQMVVVGWERYGKDAEIEAIEDIQLREQNVFKIEELNTPRQGSHSKDDRIERLEPDFRLGRFLLPGMVHNPDKGQTGRCTWCVWDERLQKIAEATGKKTHPIGTIVYTYVEKNLSRRQRDCAVTAQRYRIVEPIKRYDENRDVYDLTRVFFDEFLRHPFATHDDLIDAVSRIYDIDPQIPQVFEEHSTMGLPEDDFSSTSD